MYVHYMYVHTYVTHTILTIKLVCLLCLHTPTAHAHLWRATNFFMAPPTRAVCLTTTRDISVGVGDETDTDKGEALCDTFMTFCGVYVELELGLHSEQVRS